MVQTELRRGHNNPAVINHVKSGDFVREAADIFWETSASGPSQQSKESIKQAIATQ